MAAELAALEEKHLTHDSELSKLRAQRDQMKTEEGDAERGEETAKALAKLKEEVEEGAEGERAQGFVAGLMEAATQDKASEQQEEEVKRLERAISELQEKAESGKTSKELQADDELVDKETGMKEGSLPPILRDGAGVRAGTQQRGACVLHPLFRASLRPSFRHSSARRNTRRTSRPAPLPSSRSPP